MSSSSPALILRALAAIGVLTAASLAAPSAAHAQTSLADRALLNRATIPSDAWRAAQSPFASLFAATAATVNGERALLARSAPAPDRLSAGPTTSAARAVSPVDGARALLGSWNTAAAAVAARRPAGGD